MVAVVVLGAVVAIGVAFYIFVVAMTVPAALEERVGRLEPPPNLGKWIVDSDSEQGREAAREGLVREVRNWRYESSGKCVIQVRYKNPKTGDVERVDPEQPLKLRRVFD